MYIDIAYAGGKWLETFVNHGTSQIDNVAAGVQQLCTELGPRQAVDQDGQPVQQASLLSDIRQLLVENKDREDNVAALHGSVNVLMAAVQDDLRQGAEIRNGLSTSLGSFRGLRHANLHLPDHEAIVNMIAHQRQDQENMLRALAHGKPLAG